MMPQNMMYGMRGPMSDGNSVRNRSGEQNYTNSGNPNMPMFNTSRGFPQNAQSSMAQQMPQMAASQSGGYGSMAPTQAPPSTLAGWGGYLQDAQNRANPMPSWQAILPQSTQLQGNQGHPMAGYGSMQQPQQMAPAQGMPPQAQAQMHPMAQPVAKPFAGWGGRQMPGAMPMIRR